MALGQQIASLFVKIGADTGGLKRGLGDAESSMNRTAGGFRMGTAAMTAGLLAVGAAGVAMGKQVYDIGTSWESAFTGVRKTVNGTEAEMRALGVSIRDMAKGMPATREEIAGVAAAAGQLGVKKESILGFTKTMVDLGVSTDMSAEEAAMALARLAAVTQMPQENFDRLGSTVVELGNNLETTEREIVTLGQRLAAAGNVVGLSEHQILSFAAALSSVGIEAEAGGSAFSRVMLKIKSEVDTGGDKLRGFAEVAGMSAAQFADAYRTDAAGAIVTFIEGLGGIMREGGNVTGILDDLELSEQRVRNALLSAAGAGGKFREALELGSKAWEENTALTEEANKRYDTTASKVQIMTNKFSDLGVALFERAQPGINDFIEGLGVIADFIATDALPALDNINEAFWTLGGTTAPAAADGLGRIHGAAAGMTGQMWAAHESINAVIASLGRLPMVAAHDVGNPYGFAVAHGSDAIADARDLDDASWNSGVPTDAARAAGSALRQRERDIDAAWLRNLGRFNQEEIDWANSVPTSSGGRGGSSGGGGGAGGASAAEKAVAALEDAWKRAREVNRDMADVAGESMIKISNLGASLGRDINNLTIATDRAIQETYRAAEKALSDLEQSEILSASIAARQGALSERLSGEDKAHSIEVEDREALYKLEKDLERAGSDEERARIRQQFAYYVEDLAHRRQLQDEEAEWRAYLAGEQAKLDKELHAEEIARRRAAIIEQRDEKITALNDEFAEKKRILKEETAAAIAEEKQRATARLEELKTNFFDKLPEAAQGGAEALGALLANALGGHLAGVMGMISDVQAAAGLSGGGGGGGSTESASSPSVMAGSPGASDGQTLGGQSADVRAAFEAVYGGNAESAWIAEHEQEIRGYASGGVVPGAVGSPQLAIVHGGETVVPYGSGGGVNIYVQAPGWGSDVYDLARILKPELDRLTRVAT